MSSNPQRSQYSLDKVKEEVSIHPFDIECVVNGVLWDYKFHYFDLTLKEKYPLYDDWVGVGFRFASEDFYKQYVKGYKIAKGYKLNKNNDYEEITDGEQHKSYLQRKYVSEDALSKVTRDVYVVNGFDERVITHFSLKGRKLTEDEIQKCLKFFELSQIAATTATKKIWDEGKEKEFADSDANNGPLVYASYPFIVRYDFKSELVYRDENKDFVTIAGNKGRFKDSVVLSAGYESKGIITIVEDKGRFNELLAVSAEVDNSHLIKLDIEKSEVQRNEHGVYHLIKQDKMQLYLPTIEGRCLWCGKKLPPNKHTYCDDSTCRRQDSSFEKKHLKEMLTKADWNYIKKKYAEYFPEIVDGISSCNEDDIKGILFHYQSGQIPHQIFMSWLRGPCKECGGDIPLDVKRFDACFCSDKCRKYNYYKNGKKD